MMTLMRHLDGLNLYAFCAMNPVTYVDPSGYGSVTYTDRPIVVDGNEIGSTNYKTGEYLDVSIYDVYLPDSNSSTVIVSNDTSNQVYKDFYQSDSKVRGVQNEVNERIEAQYNAGRTGSGKNQKTKCTII